MVRCSRWRFFVFKPKRQYRTYTYTPREKPEGWGTLSKQPQQAYMHRKMEINLLQLPPEALSPVPHPDIYVDMLSLFHMLGMRPVAYQLGHVFYHRRLKSTYTVYDKDTLFVTTRLVGKSVFWVPTVDEILNVAEDNDIKVSFFPIRRKMPLRWSYIVLIHDPMFPTHGTHEMLRAASSNYWFAVARSVERAFRRRIDTIGLESVRITVHAENDEAFDNPVEYIDPFTDTEEIDEEVSW